MLKLERDRLINLLSENRERKLPKCKAIDCSKPIQYQGYCRDHAPYC